MSMGMASMKQNFDTAVEVKKRYEAVGFILATIEFEIREIVNHPEFHKVPKDEQEQMVISRARAIKYWRIQVDDYMEKNLAAWINTAVRAKSKELDLKLEEVIKKYTVPHTEFLPSEDDSRRASTAIDTAKKKVPEEVVEEEKTDEKVSDLDILEGLIADQS